MHTNAWLRCRRPKNKTRQDSTATTSVCDTARGVTCNQIHEPDSNACCYVHETTGMHNMALNMYNVGALQLHAVEILDQRRLYDV